MTDTTQLSYLRQQDWFNPAEHPDAHVTIVGAGGIGSPTGIALAKLGVPNLTLVDCDEVEAHNVPNQFFTTDDVGGAKTTALAGHMSEQAPDCQIHEVFGDLNNGITAYGGEPYGVVIAALDSMTARAELWEQVKYKLRVPLLLDARLGGETVVVYAVNPTDLGDIRGYESTLYTDDEAEPAPCTRQSIIDVGFSVASLLTRATRRHFAGEPVERIVTLDQATLKLYTSDDWSMWS